jgi:hypothetical protein
MEKHPKPQGRDVTSLSSDAGDVAFMMVALSTEFPRVPRDLIQEVLENALGAADNDRLEALKLVVKTLSAFSHE